MTSDTTFLRQFETAALPLEEWHHQQHLKVAYLYLRKHPFAEALALMRANIKAYNAAHHVPDTQLSGYHETMTQAWMRLVDFTLREYGPAENADDFCQRHPELSRKETMRLFYTRELFMSPEAKAGFIEPDLAPLPKGKALAASQGGTVVQ